MSSSRIARFTCAAHTSPAYDALGRTARRVTPTAMPTVEAYASSGTSKTVWRIDASGPATTVRSSLLVAEASRIAVRRAPSAWPP